MKFFIWSSIFIVIPLFRSIFVCFVSFSHGGRLACVWCVRPTAAIAIISSTCRSACYMLRIRYVVCTCRCQLIYLFEFRLSREPSCVVCIKYIPVTCWLLKRFLFFFAWAWTIHKENCVCFVYLRVRYGRFPRNTWCAKPKQRLRTSMRQEKKTIDRLRGFSTEPPVQTTTLRIFPPRIIARSYHFTRPLTQSASHSIGPLSCPYLIKFTFTAERRDACTSLVYSACFRRCFTWISD